MMMMPRESPSQASSFQHFLQGGLKGHPLQGHPCHRPVSKKKKIEWAGPTAGPFQGRQATEVNFAGALKPRAAPAGNFRGVAFWI